MKYLYTLLGLFYTSYALGQNLLSMQDWKVGIGSTGSYNINGQVSENVREWGEGPNGKRVVVWKAMPDGQSNADGGFDWGIVNIDHTNMYRFSVWLKKTNSYAGDSYLGCSTVNNVDGTTNTNPYFWHGDLPLLDRWYLVVGYIHGSGDPSMIGYGGIYDGITGEKVLATTDFKFPVGETIVNLRSYLYYDPEVNDRQYFYAPRIDLVNGDEPTIASLLGIEAILNNSTKLTVQDTRAVTTTPNTYSRSFEPHFKAGSILGLPNTYYTILGLRGWNDTSGGKAHELAFSNDGQISFRSGSTSTWEGWRSLMVSTENGNYGIGTTEPQTRLQIEGSATNGSIGTEEVFKVGRKLTEGVSFQQVASLKLGRWAAPGGIYESNTRLDIALKGNAPSSDYNADVTIMTLQNNGNVGIGTTTPKEMLSVNGKIRTHEIKVETANWPDYVFEEGYKVGKLEELEGYIKANKRLPEMPSAKEAEANGVALGEMNKLLLKKIEELTLQLIELNKKVDAQQREIKQLKKN